MHQKSARIWRNGFRYPIDGWDLVLFSLFVDGILKVDRQGNPNTRYWSKNWRERGLLVSDRPGYLRMTFEPLLEASRNLVEEFPHPEDILRTPTYLATLAALPLHHVGFERFTIPTEGPNQWLALRAMEEFGWLNQAVGRPTAVKVPKTVERVVEAYRILHQMAPAFQTVGHCIHQMGTEAAWIAAPQSGKSFAYLGPRRLGAFDVWALRGRAEAGLWANQLARGPPPPGFTKTAQELLCPATLASLRFQALARGYRIDAWLPFLLDASAQTSNPLPESFRQQKICSTKLRMDLQWH